MEDAIKQRISEAMRGRPKTLEHRQRIARANAGRLPYPNALEVLEKYRQGMRDMRLTMTDEEWAIKREDARVLRKAKKAAYEARIRANKLVLAEVTETAVRAIAEKLVAETGQLFKTRGLKNVKRPYPPRWSLNDIIW